MKRTWYTMFLPQYTAKTWLQVSLLPVHQTNKIWRSSRRKRFNRKRNRIASIITKLYALLAFYCMTFVRLRLMGSLCSFRLYLVWFNVARNGKENKEFIRKLMRPKRSSNRLSMNSRTIVIFSNLKNCVISVGAQYSCYPAKAIS